MIEPQNKFTMTTKCASATVWTFTLESEWSNFITKFASVTLFILRLDLDYLSTVRRYEMCLIPKTNVNLIICFYELRFLRLIYYFISLFKSQIIVIK